MKQYNYCVLCLILYLLLENLQSKELDTRMWTVTKSARLKRSSFELICVDKVMGMIAKFFLKEIY